MFETERVEREGGSVWLTTSRDITEPVQKLRGFIEYAKDNNRALVIHSITAESEWQCEFLRQRVSLRDNSGELHITAGFALLRAFNQLEAYDAQRAKQRKRA